MALIFQTLSYQRGETLGRLPNVYFLGMSLWPRTYSSRDPHVDVLSSLESRRRILTWRARTLRDNVCRSLRHRPQEGEGGRVVVISKVSPITDLSITTCGSLARVVRHSWGEYKRFMWFCCLLE